MSGDGFLSRWARRKQEAGQEAVRRDNNRNEVAEQVPPADASEAIAEVIVPHDPEAVTPEELAALPPVEEITDPTDFSQYLRKGVPQVLRNAAMRRLWMLDPVIRNYVDPALDYAYDWNIPGGVPGNGPLAAGYDAKGAAEKFFSTMRGKISNETGEWEVAEQAALSDCDMLTQDDDLAEPSAEFAALRQADDFDQTTGEDSSCKSPVSGEAPATFVVETSSPAAKEDAKTLAKQGAPRRHGRALPV